ncbi:leukocyte cysteine proteinase inhibitor 1-like [Cebidichthys violaceus]|uniref:leukocyte cysteine proteinase inhibitor 1-like n=1 Tax=Cebidichthys violaceus TaxID=271503 RepID=UPI0035CACD92
MAAAEGWSDTMDANQEIQTICDREKPQVETMTGANYVDFKAVKYRNQSVRGGENLIIKVHLGEVNYIHLSLYKPFDGKVQIRGIEQKRTKEDELTPFPI